ncbi:transposase [Streptomyces sp. NPDC001222]|uniref:transposase n=1 Tax=Streptomyces sp. NPDC001222 TaxID=3364548 RepID=UPI0036B2FD6A
MSWRKVWRPGSASCFERLAPSLLAVPGCGVLGAAVIIGETAGTARFKSKDAFAPFTGTAPIPVRSSHKVHVRLNRGGHRAINHALQMIAVTQVRRGGEGAGYFDRQLARGKAPKEAVRLLRRRISDRVLLRFPESFTTRTRQSIHVFPVHRPPARGRHRRLHRRRRQRPGQRAHGVSDRPLQDGATQAPQALKRPSRRRTRHRGMGRLVQNQRLHTAIGTSRPTNTRPTTALSSSPNRRLASTHRASTDPGALQ